VFTSSHNIIFPNYANDNHLAFLYCTQNTPQKVNTIKHLILMAITEKKFGHLDNLSKVGTKYEAYRL
jgi:hypothetical protein